MSEEVKVKPTPIQRNPHDVAIELLKIHIQNETVDYSVEGLQNLYAKFYSTARCLESVHFKYLKDYLPKELKELIGQF